MTKMQETELYGRKRVDMHKNEDIQGKVGATAIEDKKREN